MAGRGTPSFPVQLLVLVVLLAVAGRALAGRQIPPSMADSKNDDKKQPQWFIEPDNTGSVLIPGIGRIMVPPKFQHHHHYKFPYYGSSGGYGGSSGGYSGSSGGSYGGSTGRSYVPGGDDTLVPNPGVEVPNP